MFRPDVDRVPCVAGSMTDLVSASLDHQRAIRPSCG